MHGSDEVSDADLRLDSERDGTRALVRVVGELDAYTSPKLAELCAGLYDDGVRQVAIDFSGTSFLDSSALRALLVCHRQLTEGGGAMRIARVSEPVRRLLEITGLLEHFGVDTSYTES